MLSEIPANVLRTYVVEWLTKATNSRDEAKRIRNTIKAPTDAEERCIVRAEVWEQCAAQIEAAIRQEKI